MNRKQPEAKIKSNPTGIKPVRSALPESFSDWTETNRILLADVEQAARNADKTGDAFDTRSYVRAVFAAIEGDLFGMKRVIIERWKETQHPFKGDDLEQLLERPVILANTPQKSGFLPFHKNLKFVFKCFAEVHGSNFQLKFNHADWQALLDAVEVRNRLAHPKRLEDLTVTEKEQVWILQGARWYFFHRNRLFDLALEVLGVELARIPKPKLFVPIRRIAILCSGQ
ncbi:hypothetical protein GC207_14885 [bacterium]|nr:hypothetical protein [bacterium]